MVQKSRQVSGDFEWFEFSLFPPRCFVASLMELPMMATTKRSRELIADFHADGAGLGKAKMVRIGWLPAADEAGLGGDEFEMDPVVYPLGRGDGQSAFIDAARC
jgi:hypothetical protein